MAEENEVVEIPGQHEAVCAGGGTKHGVIEMGTVTKYCVTFNILKGPMVGNTVVWTGGFKGGGMDFSRKAMATCGWDGTGDPRSQKLDKTVKITLQKRTYTDKEGKKHTITEVKYINPLEGDGGGFSMEKYKMDKSKEDAFMNEFLAQVRTSGDAPTNGSTTAQTPPEAQFKKGEKLPF